jgi:hypothetical protein
VLRQTADDFDGEAKRIGGKRRAAAEQRKSKKLALVAKPRVQLRKPFPEQGDILRIDRRQLPKILLVDVRHLAGFDGFEKFDDPITFLMPIFRTHKDAPAVDGKTDQRSLSRRCTSVMRWPVLVLIATMLVNP